MFGDDGNDVLYGIDHEVNNDDLDGGTGTNICVSDPDTQVNCES